MHYNSKKDIIRYGAWTARLRLGYLFDIGLCTAAGGKESITDLLQLRRSWRSAGDDMAIFNYSTVICVE